MNPSSPDQLALSDGSSESVQETPGPTLGPEDPNDDPDREYGCKYCDKKFSNKQALGGHQNAHKVERAMEKTAREMHENVHFGRFGCAGGSSCPIMPAGAPYLGSYNRSHDFTYHAPPPPPLPRQRQQHGIRLGYNGRPGLPLVGSYPYGPSRPMPGISNVYSGWGAHQQMNVHLYPRHSSNFAQNHGGLNFRYSNIGVRSSSNNPRPFYPDLSGSIAPSGVDEQVEDNSGLDLSLKL